MIQIDLNSPVAINDQIKAGLRGLVAKGLLKPGDPVPSIRSLAVDLTVNPNTVARAFRELAQEGFLESRRGGGNFIAAQARRHAQDGLSDVKETLKEAVVLARRAGLPWEEIQDLLNTTKGEEQ